MTKGSVHFCIFDEERIHRHRRSHQVPIPVSEGGKKSLCNPYRSPVVIMLVSLRDAM